MWTEGLAHGGKRDRQEAVQMPRPLPVQLPAKHLLPQGVVLDVQEVVAWAQPVHATRLQPAPQPFSPIECNLNGVREPRLNSHVHHKHTYGRRR